eukprot:scaffold51525_cov63-Phaeocystis_antarctica.AAC.7
MAGNVCATSHRCWPARVQQNGRAPLVVLCVPGSHMCMPAAIPRCMWQDGGGGGAWRRFFGLGLASPVPAAAPRGFGGLASPVPAAAPRGLGGGSGEA